MTILKLIAPDGEIMGGIVLPPSAIEILIREKTLCLYAPSDPPKAFDRTPLADIQMNTVRIEPSHARRDGVMIVEGNLWLFEKCSGCFFIPGYAFSQKGRH